MTVECQYSGGTLRLDDGLLLGTGGEGAIYALPGNRDLVAKIYHAAKRDVERVGKLTAMLANAPDDPMREKDHASIAWPVELVTSPNGAREVIGFLMPRLHDARPISTLYDVTDRPTMFPSFGYGSLCRTARNLASAVRALHQSGYVIGDVNESNFLVTEKALVTIVDTDSFQVREAAGGRVYRCPVGTEMFTPPELHGKNFAEIDRAPEHDLFGLAVLFFQLLMEGARPFAGIYLGHGEPPDYAQRLIRGYFPYGGHPLNDPPRVAPPFEMLHPRLRDLFRQCFVDGHSDPRRRPDARTWYHALRDCESALITCSSNQQHQYFNHYGNCPWCARARHFASAMPPNWDPFPSTGRAPGSAKPNPAPTQPPAGTPPPAPAGPTPRPRTPRPSWTPPAVTPPPTVAPPPSSFSASALNVALGQAVTLQWAVPHAQTVRINDQSGRLVFVGSSPNGSVTIHPTKTGTYHLTASGVGVNPPGPVTVSVTKVSLPAALKPAQLELNSPSSLKAVQGLLAGVSLNEIAARLRSPLRLHRYRSLRNYVRLRRVSGRFKSHAAHP